MSRVGLKPIEIPQGVEISVDNHTVTVKGSKGSLVQEIPQGFTIKQEGEQVELVRPNEEKNTKALHGLFRSLIANMVEGVSKGYEKKMRIEGTGYRAQKQGNALLLNLGFSHPINMPDPEGITTEVPDERTIIVRGTDKQLVGSHAANIRKWRLPEPYKGKGIIYDGEHIRRKEGKTGK